MERGCADPLQILGIRKVLGDHHNQLIFIETFPRRGYIEEGTAAPSALSLDLKNKMVGRGAAWLRTVGNRTTLSKLSSQADCVVRAGLFV